MEGKIEIYSMASGITPDSLKGSVNEHIGMGYEPWGFPFEAKLSDGPMFCQAMVKREEREIEDEPIRKVPIHLPKGSRGLITIIGSDCIVRWKDNAGGPLV